MMRLITLAAGILLSLVITTQQAFAWCSDPCRHPYYVGVSGGYGWTTWGGLVPDRKDQNFATRLSTPKYVTENGALWGLFAGVELLPCFALEAAYFHYPNAKVSFDEKSLYAFDHKGLVDMTTKTEIVSLMAKFMLAIPCTQVKAYSSLGLAEVHRNDNFNNRWISSPTFGAGLNYDITCHIMSELGLSYTAGRGKSSLRPANDYFPFLYSTFLRIAYRF